MLARRRRCGLELTGQSYYHSGLDRSAALEKKQHSEDYREYKDTKICCRDGPGRGQRNRAAAGSRGG